jgi:hypothetical protein
VSNPNKVGTPQNSTIRRAIRWLTTSGMPAVPTDEELFGDDELAIERDPLLLLAGSNGKRLRLEVAESSCELEAIIAQINFKKLVSSLESLNG